MPSTHLRDIACVERCAVSLRLEPFVEHGLAAPAAPAMNSDDCTMNYVIWAVLLLLANVLSWLTLLFALPGTWLMVGLTALFVAIKSILGSRIRSFDLPPADRHQCHPGKQDHHGSAGRAAFAAGHPQVP